MTLDAFADQQPSADHGTCVGDPFPQASPKLSAIVLMPAEAHAEARIPMSPIEALPSHPIGIDQASCDAQQAPVDPGPIANGHAAADAHTMCAVGDPIESGQYDRDDRTSLAALDPTPPQAIDALSPRPSVLAAAAEETCAIIRRLHRRAQFCTAQRVAIGNRLLAFVRVEFLGFSTLGDETTREKQRKAAQALVTAARKDKEMDLPPDDAAVLKALVAGTDEALRPFETIEENCLKQMEKLVRQIPGYGFMLATKGFGPRSFARIIGETGPLHRYANPAKVWKRLGLAVIGGERQRKHSDAELALIHGYNPARRSVSWVAFDSLLKAQGQGETAGPYRQFYDHAKARYLEREWTKLHAHRAAARYSEKKLLRDLWKSWRNELRGHLDCDAHPHSAPHPLSGQNIVAHQDDDAAHPIEGQLVVDTQRVTALDPLPGHRSDDAKTSLARQAQAA
jgi:hypothetical protein